MRPIHCTDLKRETVYVKDENSWEKDDDYLKIALNSMGGQTDEEHDKYVDKIMRNVLKEVVIEKK